jgi:hypothetical protein
MTFQAAQWAGNVRQVNVMCGQASKLMMSPLSTLSLTTPQVSQEEAGTNRDGISNL